MRVGEEETLRLALPDETSYCGAVLLYRKKHEVSTAIELKPAPKSGRIEPCPTMWLPEPDLTRIGTNPGFGMSTGRS